MHFRGKKKLIKFSLLSLLSFSLLFAANWFPIYEDAFLGNINDATNHYSKPNEIYAVSDGGRFNFSTSAGYDWQEVNVGDPRNLLSIAAFINFQNLNAFEIIVAGQDGVLLKSSNDPSYSSWTPISSPTGVDINTIFYDSYSNLLWIGGIDGQV